MDTRVENLAMLYQGALTAVVRIQAERQQVGSAGAFRRRMKDVLAEIDREALERRYTAAHTAESSFAFVSFLDEVILNSHDPCRDDWAKRPLQEDLYGSSTAGEQFFLHLDKLLSRPETQEWIDVLEVYLLCLLLGYQGRYVGDNRAELALFAERVQQRIERARGVSVDYSPDWALPSESLQPPATSDKARQLKMLAVWTAGFAGLCFLVSSIHLWLYANSVDRMLLRSVVP
jgi:type VI secretion system protein ImpK